MSIAKDEILGGRYRVMQSLGAGGFGATYLVRDQTLSRCCVLKASTRHQPSYQKQFKREAQMLANLNHPNLPQVYDYFVEKGCPYFVMQFIPGKTLDQLKQERQEPFELEQVLRWADDLFNALSYLHSHNPPIIHRDVKPSNVCITPQETAVLLDFGIARQLDQTRTRTEAQAQSAHYAPIEQYSLEVAKSSQMIQQYLQELQSLGIHTGPYSDVYSLGATLYFALTFSTLPDARLRKLGENYPPLHELNPAVPEYIARAIERALMVDPRERCQTIAELQSSLVAEAKPRSWIEEFRAAADRADIEIFGAEDIRHAPHAQIATSALRAYGSSTKGFVYIEPCLHRKDIRPPDLILVHPDVGVLVIVSESCTLGQIKEVRNGKFVIDLCGFPEERDLLAETRKIMVEIKNATEEITGIYQVPLFNFAVALPSVLESDWRLKRYDQHIKSDHLLFQEHLDHPGRLERWVRAWVHKNLAMAPISEPLTEEQCRAVRRVFGDSSVINENFRVRPVPDEKLGALVDRLVNQEKRLSAEQEELSRADFEGHPQLIRGVAGSGKTIVLANNAARFVKRRLSRPTDLFAPEKRKQPRIGIICFNRSLVSFIKQKVQQVFKTQMGLDLDDLPGTPVTIRHINGLFYFELSRSKGGPLEYISTQTFKNPVNRACLYQKQLKRLAQKNPGRYQDILFDAIYVDEGQDFEPEEFKLLLDLIRPDEKTGEKSLVIFYDNAQNLYGRRLPTWSSDVGIDIAKGKRSRVMKQCFRNTRPIIELAFNVLLGAKAPSEMQVQTRGYADVRTLLRNDLVKELPDRWQVNFTERGGPPPKVMEFNYQGQKRKWITKEINRLIEVEQVRPEDIMILCKTKDEARKIGRFVQRGVKGIEGLVFPFANEMKDRYIFQKGHLTVSTIHSAKGYDAWIVFMTGVEQYDSDVKDRAVFYVGATRSKLLLNISGIARSNSLLKEALQVHQMLFD